jgi:catechol 2,3-dioxygenase-like lactoylglutathione lyase family enzyme
MEGRKMTTKLTYAILFVSDMDAAVRFYRDRMGFPLLFQSPYWSELDCGETRLALHPASVRNPAGKIQLGFHVADLDVFYQEQTALGIQFTQPPADEQGTRIARFIGPDGLESSVS